MEKEMTKRAIVIGAGAAGVSAAFRLQQAGCAVRLIERDAEVGGRTRSKRENGFIMDIAAGLMPSTYTAVFRLMEDAGLKDMLEPMRSPTAIYRDGKLHYIEAKSIVGSMMKTKIISLGSKLKLIPAVFTASKMWNSLGFVNLGLAAPYDNEDESLADFTRRVMSEEVLEYLVNPMQKLMYVTSAAQSSVIDLFWSVKNLFADDAFCVKGGMGCIVDEICEQLNVSLNTEVLSVTEVGNTVEVTMRGTDGIESTETVDICVIATPANLVPNIDRGLSEADREYLRKLRYSKLADVHVQLRERPTEKAVLIMVPDTTDKDLCGVLLDHNKGNDRAPPNKGSLSIYLDDVWVRKNQSLSDEEVFQTAMAKAEKVLPGVTALVDGYHVQRWDFAATLSYPGCYKAMAKFVSGLDTKRRVQLAGDYFSLASVNSAVTSGELSAKRLLNNFVY
jgi:oxygen-dependent protoporphyrinogen oxidase